MLFFLTNLRIINIFLLFIVLYFIEYQYINFKTEKIFADDSLKNFNIYNSNIIKPNADTDNNPAIVTTNKNFNSLNNNNSSTTNNSSNQNNEINTNFIKQEYDTSPGAPDIEIQKKAHNLIAQFSAVLNRRKQDMIKAFINFYFDKDAKFIKKTSLYDSYTPNKIIVEENIALNKDEYEKYIATTITAPLKYAISSKVENIKIINRFMFMATVKFKEITISSVKNNNITENINDKTKNSDNKMKTIFDTRCNIVLRQSATMVINGMNCIEKIIIY
ncbi:hypothetical protein [Lyticum sinuosum]|uniref:Uncharacterized protein n=1 Tax=Lyticum sinuosum TaxID=1332059 RepID=A0AAE5AGL6_9RICK|nr:hypothetical protein [Lyticum sinuosum]MDZ5760907.1 hypothetical protein [Lyticum sinuosum]